MVKAEEEIIVSDMTSRSWSARVADQINIAPHGS